MIKKYILYLLCLLCYGCSINVGIDTSKDSKQEQTTEQNLKLPNDVQWVTNSSEYKTLVKQIYTQAWENIDALAFNTINSKEQWVIIMDLDETVLDNSDYQIKLFENNETYNPESWSVWVNLKEAKLVPGSKEFIDNVRALENIQLIFLSNRMAKNLTPTIENMTALGVYAEQDIFLLRENKADKKNIRRDEVTQGIGRMKDYGSMKVLAYFGDASHDFPEEDSQYKFGYNMFMFPNPMYGKW